MEKLTFRSFCNPLPNTDDCFTLEKLQEAINLVYPILYYATSNLVNKGELYYCNETNWNPEFITCHPDDLETIKKVIKSRRLVDFKNEPIDDKWRRIMGSYKFNLDMSDMEV